MGTIVKENKQAYVSAFETLKKGVFSSDPSWLKKIREQAISHFDRNGFPTPRLEEWKYTHVDPIVKSSFQLWEKGMKHSLTLETLTPFLFEQNHWNRLVFVNGCFDASLSQTENLPQGVQVRNLNDVVATDPDLISKHLAQYSLTEKNSFTALNTAFIEDGYVFYLPKGVQIKEPIHFLFITDSEEGSVLAHPRNLIIADEGAQATVIESYVSKKGISYFNNTVTEIRLEQSAKLHYYKIQNESEQAFHIAATQVHQERDSYFSSFVFSLGAALARQELNVVFQDEGTECILDGLYLVKGSQHVDHHTLIDHKKPHGTSNQLYKGILDGRSTAVFNGKVHVHKDAQQTDAHQMNKNLMLSDQATVDTKPQLDIYANDVKCTHGAAIGQLEDHEMFYLKSRGISEEMAKSLLTYGFASELISRVRVQALKERFNQWLWQWMGETPLLHLL